MNIKAVIFDVDGVLIDTVPIHFKAWEKMFNEQNIKFTMKDYILKVNGIPRINGIMNILPNIDNNKATELAKLKQTYFLTFINNKPPSPIPNVIKLLNGLRKNRILLAAASSSKNAPTLLKKANLYKYFSIIVSGHDFIKSKPDPEIFLTTSKRMNINPKNCAVVEDALTGIQAAKNAGMYTIGILSSNDSDISKTADFTVQSMTEYQKILHILTKNNPNTL